MTTPNGPLWMLTLWLRLSRKGAVLPLGAVLCAAGLTAWAVLGWAARDAAADLAAQVQRARAQLRAPAATQAVRAAPSDHDALRLAEFQARLGEPSTIGLSLSRVFALARRHEVSLAQGEYKWLVDPAAETERYQMRLPLKGSYPALRQFMAQVLAEVPAASLDELVLHREDMSDDALSAVVQFSLHLQPGAASAAAQRARAATAGRAAAAAAPAPAARQVPR